MLWQKEALPFTKPQNFRLVQTESICRRLNKYDSKIETCYGMSKKYCRKRRKCWLPAFSTFLQCFRKNTLSRLLKVGLCGKGLTHSHTMTTFDAPGKQAF